MSAVWKYRSFKELSRNLKDEVLIIKGNRTDTLSPWTFIAEDKVDNMHGQV